MSKLIIIRGNSGSGKSTIAKQLQHELGHKTMLVPQDVVRREILRTKDVPKNPSIQLMKDIATYGHTSGYDVVIEGILIRKRYGKMLQEVITLFDEVYVYYLNISLEETLRRHKTKPNAHEFGEDQIREWYVSKDVLGVPGEKIFTDEQSCNEIVKSILSDMQ